MYNVIKNNEFKDQNYKIIRVFYILIIALMPFSSQASGWTLKKGGLYAQLSSTYIKSNRLFNKNDPKVNLWRSVQDITVQAYLEYGVTNRLTVMGSLPFKFTATSEKTNEQGTYPDTLIAGKLNFLGNARFGAKYKVIDKELALALGIWVDANTSDFNNFTGLQTGIDAWSVYPYFGLSRSYGQYYFSIEAGMSFRNNEYSNAFLGKFEFGYEIGKEYWLIGVLQVEKSMINGEKEDCCVRQTGLYMNNQEHVSYGLKAILPVFKNVGFNLGVYGSVYGYRIASFPSFNAAVYLKL